MRLRVAVLAGVLVLFGAGAMARDLPPDLRGLIEGVQAHRRVAIGYLRTQNVDLGAVEIERLREQWTAGRRKLSPETSADLPLTAALARTDALLTDSLKAADGGDVEHSRLLLESSTEPLDAWRKANGIRLFSDCIADVTAAYEALDVHRVNRPSLTDRAMAGTVLSASNAVMAALDRCDREATEGLRREPEFRRLFDGMRASLRQMPDAVGARDGAMLHRLLIEQRSFERLMSFRFG